MKRYQFNAYIATGVMLALWTVGYFVSPDPKYPSCLWLWALSACAVWAIYLLMVWEESLRGEGAYEVVAAFNGVSAVLATGHPVLGPDIDVVSDPLMVRVAAFDTPQEAEEYGIRLWNEVIYPLARAHGIPLDVVDEEVTLHTVVVIDDEVGGLIDFELGSLKSSLAESEQ